MRLWFLLISKSINWLLILIEWYRLERRVPVSETRAALEKWRKRSLLSNAAPSSHSHPHHFPTPNSASIYLSCLYAESLTGEEAIPRTFNLFCFIYVHVGLITDPPGLPGENEILHLRETTNQVLLPNMVNQHPLWNSDRPFDFSLIFYKFTERGFVIFKV